MNSDESKSDATSDKPSYTVKGTVTHQALGTGFWGIIGNDDEKYRPVEMPAELQQEGLAVEAVFEDDDNQVSIFMWGKTVRILSIQPS